MKGMRDRFVNWSFLSSRLCLNGRMVQVFFLLISSLILLIVVLSLQFSLGILLVPYYTTCVLWTWFTVLFLRFSMKFSTFPFFFLIKKFWLIYEKTSKEFMAHFLWSGWYGCSISKSVNRNASFWNFPISRDIKASLP